nr:unnamed protein product [Digitaria exilis]
MTESWVQDWKHTSAPQSVSGNEASTARRSRQRMISFFGQNHSPCTAGVPNIVLFCLLQGPLLQLHSVQMEEYLHPHSSGDHTVKIIDCQTRKCLKVLQGHQRTPWVVRFHPLRSDILASGSLDCEVRLWDAKTSHCTGVLRFYRPIASIAFHANGELLAVASGHKLFILDYNNRDEAVDPPMILKTRRSLRAVQFHPYAAPYLLTAEVHNRDSEDSAMTPALLSNYAFRDIPLLGRSGVDNLITYIHNFEQLKLDTLFAYLKFPTTCTAVKWLHEQYDSTGAGTSPTRHTLPSRQIVYELRVYSLEEATFGTVLSSRAVKAAHCLTSVQFSPTSEHILLAYGRQHNSLLSTVLVDGETSVSLYTVLEVYMVYRVSDMELVRVLPSAGDEVNVACFHPSPGSGLVYGTKEGKLRFLQHSGANMGLNSSTGDNIHEYLE